LGNAEQPVHHAHEPKPVRLAGAVDELDAVRNRGANLDLGQHEILLAALGLQNIGGRGAHTIPAPGWPRPAEFARRKRYDVRALHVRSGIGMADRGSSGEPQGGVNADAPQLTLLHLFATPLVIATI